LGQKILDWVRTNFRNIAISGYHPSSVTLETFLILVTWWTNFLCF